jgi:hypothetical protein
MRDIFPLKSPYIFVQCAQNDCIVYGAVYIQGLWCKYSELPKAENTFVTMLWEMTMHALGGGRQEVELLIKYYYC